MRKSTVVNRIIELGFGPYLIDNCDTADKQVRLGCEYLGTPGSENIPGDYYGEFCNTNGYAWIDPRLVALADEADSYWEWENPAVISLYL